jgi:transcriptional regulator with XRE-family HTH domain
MIGDRIKRRLRELGISQAELARRVGLHQSTINGIIRGNQRSSTHLHMIARELETSTAFLTGETDDPSIDASELALDRQDRLVLDLFNHLEPADKKAVLQIMQSITDKLKIPMLQSKRAEYVA